MRHFVLFFFAAAEFDFDPFSIVPLRYKDPDILQILPYNIRIQFVTAKGWFLLVVPEHGQIIILFYVTLRYFVFEGPQPGKDDRGEQHYCVDMENKKHTLRKCQLKNYITSKWKRSKGLCWYNKLKEKTLLEAQWIQGIESKTWVISATKMNTKLNQLPPAE